MNAAAAKAPKEKVNKSAEIRKLLEKGLTNSEIIAELAKRDIVVTSPQISVTKSKVTGGSGTGKKGGKGSGPGFLKVLELLEENGGTEAIAKAIKTVEAAAEAQKLIDQFGGPAAAMEIVAKLKKLK